MGPSFNNFNNVGTMCPLGLDVFLMICRKKSTIFTDAKESTTIGEVKKIIEGIVKVPPQNQRLFKFANREMIMTDDNKTLSDYGYTSAIARAQAPAAIGLAFRRDGGGWEPLDIKPLSTPPELPDVMKPQDPNQQEPNISFN